MLYYLYGYFKRYLLVNKKKNCLSNYVRNFSKDICKASVVQW